MMKSLCNGKNYMVKVISYVEMVSITISINTHYICIWDKNMKLFT